MTETPALTPREGTPRPLGLVGQQLDQYVIHEELGQGGMSVVYRARDTVLQRDVAIKVLHPFLADRQDARRRLAREARAVAKLRHPHILEVYGYSGEEAATGYIAMELVRGETLKQFGERHRFQPCEVAAAITWVVAGALQHAHDSGVIHRDVKPENVMIRQDGVLKLMDFGIAHVVDAAHLTITGTLQGSPAHMAPEVIEGQDVDARADLFSLGTVLYWLATGQLPFTAKTPHALLKRIVEGRYTEPQRLNAEISDRLASIIRQCLAREPAERFASADALRAALQVVMDEGGLEDPALSVPAFFKNPQKCTADWSDRAASRFVEMARVHVEERDRVNALADLNRVLALRPEHPDAAALMKRLERQTRSAGRLRIGLGISAIVGLAAVSAWVTTRVDQAAVETPPRVEEPPPPQVVTAPETPPASGTRRPLAPRPRSQPRVRGGERLASPVVPEPVADVAAANTTAPVAVTAELHDVTVRAHPYATLEVDGKPSGTEPNSPRHELRLAAGRHTLRFTHQYAQSHEQEIDVVPGRATTVAVQLHRAKPSYIKVVSTDDPDVFIDGVYKGTAHESERTPILFPLPEMKWNADVRITLKQKGKETVEFSRRVVAGETTEIRAGMRDPGAPTREVIGAGDPPAPHAPVETTTPE